MGGTDLRQVVADSSLKSLAQSVLKVALDPALRRRLDGKQPIYRSICCKVEALPEPVGPKLTPERRNLVSFSSNDTVFLTLLDFHNTTTFEIFRIDAMEGLDRAQLQQVLAQSLKIFTMAAQKLRRRAAVVEKTAAADVLCALADFANAGVRSEPTDTAMAAHASGPARIEDQRHRLSDLRGGQIKLDL